MLKAFTHELMSGTVPGVELFIDMFPFFAQGTEKNASGDSALHIAVSCGSLPGVRKLLKTCPKSIDVRSMSGKTPLAYAIMSGNVDMAQLLLSKGASVLTRNHNNNVHSLRVAVMNNNLSMFKYLARECKMDVNMEVPGECKTCLMTAIDKNLSEEFFHEILNEGALILKVPEGNKFGAMISVAGLGRTNILRLMAETGEWDINYREPQHNLTMLDIAANNNQIETCKFLLEDSNLNINATAPDGTTAFMHAAADPDFSVMALLLSHGADPKPVNEKGESAMNIALRGM